jgi:hypothetical protein
MTITTAQYKSIDRMNRVASSCTLGSIINNMVQQNNTPKGKHFCEYCGSYSESIYREGTCGACGAPFGKSTHIIKTYSDRACGWMYAT